MGWFSKSKTDEQIVTVTNDQLDKKQAQLETKGFDVTGEKTLKGNKTEISYRVDPDYYYCGICGKNRPIGHFPH